MSCEVDNEGRILDAITYMPIPHGLIIRVKSGENVYCFNIDTIYRSMVKSNNNVAVDPFTRNPFPPEITAQAQNYGKTMEISIIFETMKFHADYFTPVGDIIVHLLKTFPDLEASYGFLRGGTRIDIKFLNFEDEIINFACHGELRIVKIYQNDVSEFHQKVLDYTAFNVLYFDDQYQLVNDMIQNEMNLSFDDESAFDDDDSLDIPINNVRVELFRDMSDDEMLANPDDISDDATINIYKIFGLVAKGGKIVEHAGDFWKNFDDQILSTQIVNAHIQGSQPEIQSIYRTIITLSPQNKYYKPEHSYVLVALLKKLIPAIYANDYHSMMMLRYHIMEPSYRLIDEIIQSHFLDDMMDPSNILELDYSDFWNLEYPLQPQHLNEWKEGTINKSPGVIIGLKSMIRTSINANRYAGLKNTLLARKDFNILLNNGLIRLP